MEGPCKECKYSGCGRYHDECEKYIEYKKKVEEARHKKAMHYVSNYNRARRDIWKIRRVKNEHYQH